MPDCVIAQNAPELVGTFDIYIWILASSCSSEECWEYYPMLSVHMISYILYGNSKTMRCCLSECPLLGI